MWEVRAEEYLRDPDGRYQGTIDVALINEEEKKVKLYDTKSWGIAKKRFRMKIKRLKNGNMPKASADKLKKVALQLSFYAEYYRKLGYTIEGIYCVVLDQSGAYEYKLDLWDSKDLDEIIESHSDSQEYFTF